MVPNLAVAVAIEAEEDVCEIVCDMRSKRNEESIPESTG